MIETNAFQILNSDTLQVLHNKGGDISVQITYMRKEMRRNTVLFTPVLP